MGKIFVFSTLSSDNAYGPYTPGAADLPVRNTTILIRGGAGVVGRKHLITPRGVCTEITEEDLAICRQDVTFQHHEKNGFIEVSVAAADPDKVAAGMEGRDLGAPLVPQDFVESEPTVELNKEAIQPAPVLAPKSSGRRNR